MICIVADEKAVQDEVDSFVAYMQTLYAAYNARYPDRKKTFVHPIDDAAQEADPEKEQDDEKSLSGLLRELDELIGLQTVNVLDTAKNGVLFIDEAYALSTGGRGDYGHEAIQTILKRMEDDRDKMVIIVAGYPKLMEQFVESNPGLRSRFSKTIFFPDYTPDELIDILQYIAEKNNMKVSTSGLAYAGEIIRKRYETRGENFANAREVRNMFEHAVLVQADRLYGKVAITDEELCTLEADDFRMVELTVEADV